MKRVLFLSGAWVLGAQAFATNLPLSFFTSAPQTSHLFNGFMRDRSTGTYYRTTHYSGTTLISYGGLANFQNDTGGSTVVLGDNRFGTYGVVRNGKLFMRGGSNPNGTDVLRFDAATGAVEVTSSFPAYAGNNGTDTFDWGGYSAFNLFDDPSGLFMFARDLSGIQRVAKLDNNLNLLSSYVISGAPTDPLPGFAFNIKGQLFIGDDFFVPTVSQRVDLATGNVSTVNFNFTGVTGFPYFSHAWYDDLSDRLYMTSAGSGGGIAQSTYYLDNAAAALGVVPEPASIVAMTAGLSLLLRRRRASGR